MHAAPKIYKLVFSGGPCAGKSEALSCAKSVAEANGFAVFIVSETATELILSGKTEGLGAGTAQFEARVFDLQLEREAKALKDALTLREHEEISVLILCDRGLMDPRAYTTEEQFLEICSAHQLTKQEILARYEAVFYFESAAVSLQASKQSYTTANNKARFESREEAARVEANTRPIWQAHPCFIFIPSKESFEEKLAFFTKEFQAFCEELRLR